MAEAKDSDKPKSNNVFLEEALEIVGEGGYTKYLCFVCGLCTLACVSSMQYLYFVLPTVSCELKLSSVDAAFLGSSTFIGTLVSTNILGFVVDQYGRRKFLVIATFGISFSSFLASLSPNAKVLTTLTFISGFMLGGVFGLPYVYLSEFCNKKIRSKYITLSSLLSVLSNTYSPCVAMIVMWLDIHVPINRYFVFTSWRLYVILNALPMFTSALIFLKLPESPKFLLLKGRSSEALAVLSMFYSVNNKKTLKDFPVESLCLDPEDKVSETNKTDQNALLKFIITMFKQMKELFKLPTLIYTVICSLLMVGVVGLYSIILLWFPHEASRILKYKSDYERYDVTLCELMSRNVTSQNTSNCQVSKETYLIISLLGLAVFTLSALQVFLVKEFKVKYILGINIFIASGLLFYANYSTRAFVTIASLGMVSALLCASQALLYSIIVESFPTSIRGTASALTLVFGRGVVPFGSPLVGAAFKDHCNLAYRVIAACLSGISVLSFIMPTKQKKILDGA